jgi:hypothetical protein
MSYYVIYDVASGAIVANGRGDNPADQCQSGQSYRMVPTPVTGDTHRVDLATGLVCLRDDAVTMPPPI